MIKDNWIECQSCWAEFRVVADTDHTQRVVFCPFCGSDVDAAEEDDEDYE